MKKMNLVFMGDSLTAGVYSDGKLDYRRRTYPNITLEYFKKENRLLSYYNIAVPGFTTVDMLKVFSDDLTYNENAAYNITPEISYRKANYRKEQSLKLISPDIKIEEIIKKADIITMTIGSNDIILYLNLYKDELENISLKDLKDSENTLDVFLNSVEENFKNIISYIRSINSDAYIIFIGSYTPQKYSVINNILDKYLSSIEEHILNTLEGYYSKMEWLAIREDIKSKKEEYIDNVLDVHLSEKGYELISMKLIDKINTLIK